MPKKNIMKFELIDNTRMNSLVLLIVITEFGSVDLTVYFFSPTLMSFPTRAYNSP